MKKGLIIGLILFSGWLLWWTIPDIKSGGTIKIRDRNGELLYETAGNVGRKQPVSYNQFPKYLIDGAVAAEDKTYFTNPGIDPVAMLRAAFQNLKYGQIVSGGSTITQQLARIAVIADKSIYSHNWLRKIRESLIAIRLTLVYSKQDILTQYLNNVYFGHLAYGAQAAARTYFHKDVSQLSLAQSAYLVSLISTPENDPSIIRRRQTEILNQLESQKFISREQATNAKTEEMTLYPPEASASAPHFVDYVRQQLADTGINYSGGINVITTLDGPDFMLAQDIAREWVKKLSGEHDLSNASLVMLDNRTGAIRVMLGGIDYADATHAGQVNLTTASRQPGSALKPITYAAAFDMGYTPATLIYDVQTVYQTHTGEGFTPNNYDGRYHGLVLVREALASSLNQPAVEMLNRIGIGNFLQTAADLGIRTLKPDPKYDLALTLGGGEVTLLDLTNVYASLARGGSYLPPYAIEKITDDSGRVIYQHHPQQSKQVWGNKSPQIAYLITDILADPLARIPGFGEKNPLVLSFPAAVKTGTTTDWHDNWTVGYTPQTTVGVWVGNNDNHPMIRLTGITGAAPIWNQFFEEIHKGQPAVTFTKPAGIVQTTICKTDGLLPGDLCREQMEEKFIAGTEPKQESQIYKQVLIDTRNNLPAGMDCPKKYLVTKVLIDYPPQVYGWAVDNGLTVIPRDSSPLCSQQANTNSASTYVNIIFPKNNSVFQSAAGVVKNQLIDLSVNTSGDVTGVNWYIDGKLYKYTNTYPFLSAWPPTPGDHVIMAEGITPTGETARSQQILIKVTEYGL